MNKIFLSHGPAGSQMAKLVCQSLTDSGNSVLVGLRGPELVPLVRAP